MKFSRVAMFSLLIFIYAEVKAQYIPDDNFAAAIANDCPSCIDANDYLTTDAQTITLLTLGMGNDVTDLTGLDGFTNLQTFICWHQDISVFPALPPNLDTLSVRWDNLTALPELPSSLRYLICANNSLTGLPALPDSLEYLYCGSNDITSLPPLPSTLQELWCGGNELSDLPALPANLYKLDCSNNFPLGSLPPLPSSLTYLNCAFDSLTTLPLLPNSLRDLFAWCNLLTSLPDLPDSLLDLRCDCNLLTSLPPLNDGLYALDCNANSLQHLPALPASLRELDASQCELLDVPPLPDSLEVLILYDNLITALPELPITLPFFDISYNPIACLPYLPPSLGGILFDETNITCLPNIPNGFYNYDYLPLCDSANPSGCFAYPIISGTVYGDFNNNTAFDIGEYHAGNVIVEANPGNYIGITDTAGNYKIGVPLSSTDTTKVIPFSVYYNPPPTYYTVTFGTSSGQASSNNDFGILAVNNGSNLEVNMTSGYVRPGFNTNLSVTISNPGTTNLDGAVILTFDQLLTFVSADEDGAPSGNIVTWNFSNFHPFQTKIFTVTINCPSGIAIGTILNHSVSGIVNGETDIDLTNNSQNISTTVVGSFDPNDKVVNDAILTPEEFAGGKYLEYTINFQNTGTAPATFITVADTLSDKLDASSFEMIAASHQYDITLANDLTKANHPVFVKWLFNNIQLPDSSTDFANSQGFVRYRIRPRNNLLIGDQIQNTAGIYFDFNEPVLTNTTITNVTLFEAIANVKDNFFHAIAFPNPAANTTTIHFDHVISPQLSLQITNEVGSVMLEKIVSVPHESFDISLDLKKFHSGIYVITVKSQSDVQVMKLVKD